MKTPYRQFKKLSIERQLLERRLFSTFFITTILMGMVANMTRFEEGKSAKFPQIHWFSCFLQSQFMFIFAFLLWKTPGQKLGASITYLTCITLAFVEIFIASFLLGTHGSFIVRIVGYILVSHMELVTSTGYKEWSLFGLFVSICCEMVAWAILIPVQNHDTGLITGIIEALISVGLGGAVWTYESYLAPHSSKKSETDNPALTDSSYRGFRYEDAVYSLSNGSAEATSSSNNLATTSSHMIEEPQYTESEYSSDPLDAEDPEIRDIRFKELADLRGHRVCILIHAVVAVVALLIGRRVFGDMTNALIFGVFINPAIALWQMFKIFGASSTALKITQVKHKRNLYRAQKDTLKTLNTLSAELKWPISALRGIVIPTATSESTPIQRTMRALLWTGHAARMLEVGMEASLETMSKAPRILSLRHVIVTFGTCLNCQSLSAVKDMHTSVSVSVTDAIDALSRDHDGIEAEPSDIEKVLKDGVPVVANHDILFYGFLALHSYIVMLADPHQEIKFQIEIVRDRIRDIVRVVITVSHWGEMPHWSLKARPDVDNIDSLLQSKGGLRSVTERDADAVQTLVENIRDTLGGSIKSHSSSRLCSTTFRFTLPGGRYSAEHIWRPRSLHAPWILIVDVAKVSRKMIKRNILRILPNAQIEECASARSAMTIVARCGAEKFDYVIADYVLSSEKRYVGGGVQLCSKLRSFAKNATIIGMTGDHFGVALSDFLLNGADLAYVKPLTHGVLNEIFAVHSYSQNGGG